MVSLSVSVSVSELQGWTKFDSTLHVLGAKEANATLEWVALQESKKKKLPVLVKVWRCEGCHKAMGPNRDLLPAVRCSHEK